MIFAKHVHRAVRIGGASTMAFSLLLSSTLMAPTPAYADTQSDLEAAQAQLSQIGEEYQSLQSQLQDAAANLEQTSSKIEETQNKLTQAQSTLSTSVTGDYKAGGVDLLQILLSSTDFNDLISRMFYVSKINEAQANAIEQVKELQTELKQQQADQEQVVEDTQAKLDEQAANQASAQALVDSLSDEVREELEAKAQEDATLAAGIQSAKQANQNTASTPVAGTDGNAYENVVNTMPSDVEPVTTTPSEPSTPSTSTSQSSEPTQPSEPQQTTTGSSSVSSPISYALAMAGQPYVYGGESLAEGGFDCSGLVYYAYQQIGITLPRTSDSQMAYVRANGRWTTSISELQYGDLVFFPGHVAFYVGNNQVFGATSPGNVASYGNIYWYGTFLGGGQI